MARSGGPSPQIVVIGAGAAGLMAAIFAAESGAAVQVLEATRDGGRKILISGGGRYNVLPSELSPDRYFTGSSRNTLKKMLLSWPLKEQIAFFEEVLGIPLSLEPETGKLFPASNRARDVRDALVREAVDRGAEIRFETRVEEIERDGEVWRVRAAGSWVRCRRLIVATGGLSVPRTGSDGRVLSMLERLGHTVHPTFPALTPLLAEGAQHADLAGVSLNVEIAAPPPGGPLTVSGGFLFTHRGYSGPAVLDVSHVAVLASNAAEQPLYVRWGGITDDVWEESLTERGGVRVRNVVRRWLPARLADRLLREAELEEDTPCGQLRRNQRSRLLEVLTRYPLPWSGNEGYRKAEVTGGGVALSEVRPNTMESRIAPGLFLCGELLDAFGRIGGYNFAWAWATGRAAGRGAAASLE